MHLKNVLVGFYEQHKTALGLVSFCRRALDKTLLYLRQPWFNGPKRTVYTITWYAIRWRLPGLTDAVGLHVILNDVSTADHILTISGVIIIMCYFSGVEKSTSHLVGSLVRFIYTMHPWITHDRLVSSVEYLFDFCKTIFYLNLKLYLRIVNKVCTIGWISTEPLRI